MLLITVSTQIIKRGLALPHKRIFLSYLIAMMTIFGSSGLFFYLFVMKSFHQQIDRELLTLVEAVAPSLHRIKNEGKQSLERDLTWHNLFTKQDYSLEWYDTSGKLLAREGKHFVKSPLFADVSPAELRTKQPILRRQGNIQTAIISIYTQDGDRSPVVLEGYIRASESNERVEVVLKQLRMGLELGAATTIVLVAASSVYLTQITVRPMKQGMQRLKRITANVSHQIRTPLTRINLATEILLTQTNKTQSSQIKKLNIINAATEQIKKLLEELLFLIRADLITNFRELDFAYVPVNGIMSNIRAEFEPIAREKGIILQTYLSDRTLLLKGDRERLQRLLRILLDNAIAYTDPGGNIFFSVQQLSNKIAIVIQDTGMGISPVNLPSIFEDFWRSEAARLKHPNGFGLGMAIAAIIVQQHQGKIEVDSELGRGTTVRVYLPLKSRWR